MLDLRQTEIARTRSAERPDHYVGRTHRATVRQTVEFRGPGIHTGGTAILRIHPAEIGTGLVFQSTDPSLESIPVSPNAVVSTAQAVTLGNGAWQVHTVEHVLAALSVHGVTDAILELNGSEVPILDGSAAEFHRGIQAAGVDVSDETIEPIRLTAPAWIVRHDKYLIAVPADEFRVTYTIDFPHPDLKGKTFTGPLNSQIMEDEIIDARTFGFLHEIEELRRRGLAQGGTLDNAIVLTETGYVNSDLRYPDECVRHKVLDLMGDLYLLGRPLLAHIIAFRAGHALDVALGQEILANIELDELKSKRQAR